MLRKLCNGLMALGTLSVLSMFMILPAASASASTNVATHPAAVRPDLASPTANTIQGDALGQVGQQACTDGGYKASSAPNQTTSCDGQAWCADFAGWVWQSAGIGDLSTLNNLADSFDSSSVGLVTNHPAIGDAVYFQADSVNGDHVAIVVGISGPNITIVSGNWGGTVAETTTGATVGDSLVGGIDDAALYAYIEPHSGVQMVNNATGQAYCLDASLGSGKLSNGDHVITYPCDGGTNEQWHWEGSTLVNGDTANGTFCLDATDANSDQIKDGDQIQVYACNGRSDENWYETSNIDAGTNWAALENGANQSYCLDRAVSTNNADLWSCNNGTNQGWTVP